jgi:hypothetical protein
VARLAEATHVGAPWPPAIGQAAPPPPASTPVYNPPPGTPGAAPPATPPAPAPTGAQTAAAAALYFAAGVAQAAFAYALLKPIGFQSSHPIWAAIFGISAAGTLTAGARTLGHRGTIQYDRPVFGS